MAVDVLLGLQWGDEGKGKITDVLASEYDIIARFQGGPNAGHTLEFEGKKHVLHQIPSGIFHEKNINVIGNGVVLDPIVFRTEIDALSSFNLPLKKNLLISKRAQLILPTHRLLDAAYEQFKGDRKIGSTLKGIGPTYRDKIARTGLRIGDLSEKDFKERYNAVVSQHLHLLEFYNYEHHYESVEKGFFDAVESLKEFQFIDSEYYLNSALQKGKKILAEGAQGAMLDIDFGTYPYVTSSTTLTAGACTGLGISPHRIGRVFGIFKAYCTRVGSGPFPTELHDETGKKLAEAGREFGSTTGRPRRCGLLDLPALKYAVMLSGATELFMMKADVLNGFNEIKVCTHYQLPDGTKTDQLPHRLTDDLIPVCKSLPGWGDIKDITGGFAGLPETLQQYIQFIESEINVPITVISLGPDRNQTVFKEVSLTIS